MEMEEGIPSSPKTTPPTSHSPPKQSPKASYSVTWNNRNSEFFATFKKFLATGCMTDMILSCGAGNKSIRCHKLILAAASHYFEEMIQNAEENVGVVGRKGHRGGSSSSFVVIIKDVEFHDLEAILTFIYEGRAMLKEDKIPGFLKAALALKIKGIVPEKVVVNRTEKELEQGNIDKEKENVDGDMNEVRAEDVPIVNRNIPAVGVKRVENYTDVESVSSFTSSLGESNDECQQTAMPSQPLKRSWKLKPAKSENEGNPKKKAATRNKTNQKYRAYGGTTLLQALKCIEKGMACAKASKLHGVPCRTLYQYNRKAKQRKVPISSLCPFTSRHNNFDPELMGNRETRRISTGMSSQTTESCDGSDQSSVDDDDDDEDFSETEISTSKRHKSK